jgi:hypothetical protein
MEEKLVFVNVNIDDDEPLKYIIPPFGALQVKEVKEQSRISRSIFYNKQANKQTLKKQTPK